ncbi:MAP7 domain-containing protein [Peptoniphilus harei]|uniref:MAP7 domain-containing protein n=1 Tax=Peptoniphilus harei TaxID=54005 RepID=UPI002550737A|nr:MAP7 domain-containing protein [Peptoniphilus harei]MDK7377458.1 MAP7 domain-containing protein [Peptoniphilus harei]MDK7679771.1 MAP7 domain-containing protein [Peptoniphilus harei]
MSNKNIRLNITADTSKAKKQIEDLKRDFGNGKLEFGKTGEKYKDSQDFSNGLNELSGVLTEFNTNVKDLSAILREFVKQNTSSRKDGTSTSSIGGRDLRERQKLSREQERLNKRELKDKERLLREQQKLRSKDSQEQSRQLAQRAKEEAKKKQDQQKALNEYGDKVTKTASLIFASMNLKSYGSNAMATAQSNNVTSMGTYGRLGIYGKDFARGTKDAYKIGAGLGYNATDTIGLQDQLLRNTGFSTKDKLDTDTTAIQRFSKAYNLDTNESMPMYSELVKRGGLGPGQAEEMSKVISTSIAKQGMEGRESEQVKAINQIFDVITSGKINVTSQDLKTSAGLLDALGKQNAALKGEKGAQLLSKAQGIFDTSDYTKLKMFGYGLDGNVGLKGLLATQRRMAKGWSDPENLEYLRKTVPMLSGGSLDSDVANIFLQTQAGFNVLETDEFLNLLRNNNSEEIYNKYSDSNTTDQEAILQNIQGSKTNAREVHQIRKEEALNSAGNGLINATSGPNAMYDSMPTGMRVAGDIGGNILGGVVNGIFMGKALKGIGGLAKVLKGGEGEVISSGINSGIFSKGLGSLKGSSVLGNLTSSGVGSSSGKLAELLPKVGKVGVALPAVIGGVQATRSFIKGDKEKGSEQLGRGLGTTGGMIAGAKLGGAAGSLIAPGLGTAAGVIGGAVVGGIGGFLGGKVGKGTYKLFSKKGSKNQEDATTTTDGTVQYGGSKKENELLAWKERLLKKEEEIFDNFLNQNKESKKESKENPNDSKNEEPSVDKFYGDTLLGNDSSSNKNNVVGNVLESLTGQPAPTKAADSKNAVEAAAGDFLGKVSAKYEVGGKRGDAISHTKGDYGGASYGIPQFSATTGSAKAFVNSLKGTPYEQYFKNAGAPGSKGFDNAWKAAYKLNPDDFTKKQQEYAFNNFASPFINKVKKQKGVDLNSTRALQELAFSTSVQFGGGSLGLRALGDINSGMNEKDIINTSFATKRNNVGSFFKSSSKQIQNSLKNNRFRTEEQDMLALLGQAPIKSYAIGTDKVDKDQLAFIHKDEAVLNKFDANEYRQQGSSQGGTINLNFNINGAGTSQENLTETIQNAVKQAFQRLGLNNGSQVNLSKSYYRYQN